MTSRAEFSCKLAHRDTIKKMSSFNSIKQLYERISQTFLVPMNEILYCTLNSHNFRDMNALLGNYLSFNDLIVVHMCGRRKELTLKKTSEYLGLTITDNGQGRAFVKKVTSASESLGRNNHEDEECVDLQTSIQPGDHIAAINSESTVGMRHYEVAKIIRELPQDVKFTIRLVEPEYKEENLNLSNKFRQPPPDTSDAAKRMDAQIIRSNKQHSISAATLNQHDHVGRGDLPLLDFSQQLDDALTSGGDHGWPLEARPISSASTMGQRNFDSTCEDLINCSLPIEKLLSKQEAISSDGSDQKLDNPRVQSGNSPNDCDTPASSYKSTIERINSILESILGIEDNLLAIRIYRLARENIGSCEEFAKAVKESELGVFDFDDDSKALLWRTATDPAAIK